MCSCFWDNSSWIFIGLEAHLLCVIPYFLFHVSVILLQRWATAALAAIFSFVRIFLETVDQTKMLFCDCALYGFREFVLNQMDDLVSQYVYTNFVLPNKNETFNWVCRPYPVLQNQTNKSFGPFLKMDKKLFICKLTDDDKFECPLRCTCYARHHFEPPLFV